jgi:hypothetical protein
MLRAYAIALGAGTQSLILVPWVLLVGMPRPIPEALLMALGWLGNLGIAEWLLRRRTLARGPRGDKAMVGPSLRENPHGAPQFDQRKAARSQ